MLAIFSATGGADAMRKLQNHLIGIRQGSETLFSHFENGGEMWAGRGSREVRRRVTFDAPFKTPPAVMTALAMFDIDAATNARADLTHANVDASGFDLIVRTWGDTRIARIRADWTAIGEIRGEDEWDVD